MRVVRPRLLPVLALTLTAMGALTVPVSASSSPWKKGAQPTCTVTVTSTSSSSTTCAGSLSGAPKTQSWIANLDVDGFAAYRCQDSTGATVAGQNQVGETAGTSTPFQTSNKSTSFTAGPTVLAAPSTVSTAQAGCADGTSAVDPTLTSFRVTLWITPDSGDGTFLSCTASDPNGLSGTVPLTC
jgi:hypothetical protein